MRKPIVKFMAGTLAAAMVVTSPITVFAGNDGFLSHIFSSDRSEPDSKTKTGTETKTLDDGTKLEVTWDKEFGTKSISNTGTLDDVKLPSTDVTADDYILGVEFDQDEINVIAGGEKQTLKAMVYTSNGEVLSSDKLKGVLSFRKLQLASEGQDLTSAKVGYAYDATAGGMGAIARDTLEIRGEHGGAFVIEARLDTNKDGKYEFTKRIPVFVKEYSQGLKINVPDEPIYLKNTYKLTATRYADKDCKTVSKTANDTITWTAYTEDTSKDNRVGKATSYLTLKEDGTLVLKKDKNKIPGNINIYVQAVGERGAKSERLLLNDSIKEAKPVTKLTDSFTKGTSAKNTIGWGVDKTLGQLSDTWKVTVVPDPADTTDQINWTVKNDQIADFRNVVKNTDGSVTAEIYAKKVGKTTVTAQAASGKKVTYTVTVKAPLVSIDKVVKAGTEDTTQQIADEIYVGQSIQLKAITNPKQSTDKVTYNVVTTEVYVGDTVVTGDDAKKVKLASVNNKTGVVTTKVVTKKDSSNQKVVVGGKVEITATGTKASDRSKLTSQAFTLTIKAPVIEDTKLTVASTKTMPETGLGTFKYPKTTNKSNANDTLYVGKDTTYTIVGDKATEGQNLTNLRNSLSWASNKAGVAAVNNGKTDALSSGKANVTASVVNKAGKKLTAKVAVTSKQAVTRLQLNKTEITLNPKTTGNKTVTASVKVSKQLPAKCTKENITWTINAYDKAGNPINKIKLKAGSLVDTTIPSNMRKTSVTIQATDVAVGDWAEVTATADNGATTTAIVRVLEKTNSVKFIVHENDVKSLVTGRDYKSALTINAGDKFSYNLYDLVAIVAQSDTKTGHRVNGKDWTEDQKYAAYTTYESVVFTTNKSGIVTIDEDGDVYGIKAGKVTITAKTPSGKSAKITITVK